MALCSMEDSGHVCFIGFGSPLDSSRSVPVELSPAAFAAQVADMVLRPSAGGSVIPLIPQPSMRRPWPDRWIWGPGEGEPFAQADREASAVGTWEALSRSVRVASVEWVRGLKKWIRPESVLWVYISRSWYGTMSRCPVEEVAWPSSGGGPYATHESSIGLTSQSEGILCQFPEAGGADAEPEGSMSWTDSISSSISSE